MNSHDKLAGKRALVTGSGTGIGREIALEFARQGADVVLHYAHSGTGAQSAAEESRALGRRATAFQAHFEDLDAVAQLARHAVEFLDGIDCLVNNAGITLNKPFLEVTPQQFDLLYDVNIRPVFPDAANCPRHAPAAAERSAISRPCTLCRVLRSIRCTPVPKGQLSPIPAPGRGTGSPGCPCQRHRTGLGDGRKLLQGDSRVPGGVGTRGGAERGPGRPRRYTAGHRPTGRIPLFRRGRIHRWPDAGGRRRYDCLDVPVPEFPRAFAESLRHRLCPGRVRVARRTPHAPREAIVRGHDDVASRGARWLRWETDEWVL